MLVTNRRGLPKEFIKTTEREELSYKRIHQNHRQGRTLIQSNSLKPLKGRNSPTKEFIKTTEREELFYKAIHQNHRKGETLPQRNSSKLPKGRNSPTNKFIKTTEREELSHKGIHQNHRKGGTLPQRNSSKPLTGRNSPTKEYGAKPCMFLHSYVVKTKSTGKRNVLLLSTLAPLLAVTRDNEKKSRNPKFIKFTTSQRRNRYYRSKSSILHLQSKKQQMDNCRIFIYS